ncbi:mannitol dehydrogenase family protein [Stappia sp. ES.058]|uniref:mannitol dehydrogenase family protein n=1 Tax=Stappia sp. ES.058 TaxID=1881061 RepID=UPI00087DF2AB|nr:mannitol dehydrogenase family protein [Stappia sp. ES.058]SDU18897.1 fructuronate reductase [Stappia sp. ES.058]
MTDRLNTLRGLPASVKRPEYDPVAHGVGIVHLGLGAFHKSHQAVYTDDALAASGGDWRIAGVSLRNPAVSEALTPQNGLFTVIERGFEGTEARVIGSVAAAFCLSTHRQPVLDALCSPATRIVSLTVSEKGYGIDRTSSGIDLAHPAIAADLKTPDHPVGVAGLIVQAIGQRRQAGAPPLTILCCDNLPENGRMVRALLLDFARRSAPGLVDHIASDIGFPSTMVDRITPAQGKETLALAHKMTGRCDLAAVETERFRQWVIEDDFRSGRPDWAAGGAIFARDVRPYELMKLRMLNGTHSLIAYAGFLSGMTYVRDVMSDPSMATLVRRHLAAAAATLPLLDGVDFDAYGDDLMHRFSNPHLAHETYQIAMDGTEKLPQRILSPAMEALDRGQSLTPYAFATAAWMRYALGKRDDGMSYALRDPQEGTIAAKMDGARDARDIVQRFSEIPALFPEILHNHDAWTDTVVDKLSGMLTEGMAWAINNEANRL